MLRLLFIIISLKILSPEEYLEVNINQGPVRGYKSSVGIYEFYGIPYATAPTGTNKFKAPLHPPSWEIPFKATERLIACPQGGKLPSSVTIKEDCLITNIYVPDTEEKNLPVVVYFHGGAYQFGYGETMSSKELVKSKKIIALNFNYRLGANGFLCLGTKDVPGNAAMKDQVVLLRWVQENIGFFGGNPDDVTLSGCSAGGSSVDLHLVSKISKGLFKKAIVESGSCMASFGVQIDPIENAKAYAMLLNFDNYNDVEKLEEFYKNAPLSQLISVDVMERFDASVMFTPCIERDVGQELMFLDNIPFKIDTYQPVPLLFGFTNLEGKTRLSYFDQWKDLMNVNFTNFLPENLVFKNEKERMKVAEEIKYFYFGNETLNNNSIMNFVEYLSDTLFTYSILKSIELHTEAGNNNIFFYEYSFNNKYEDTLPYTNLDGAGHCAQSIAVLDEDNENNMSDEYKNMKTVMRELWLNFITTGKPVPQATNYPVWLPVKKDGAPYMSLNSILELFSKLN